MNLSKNVYNYFQVYQMPQGDWGASCFCNVTDGFINKEDALLWVIETMFKELNLLRFNTKELNVLKMDNQERSHFLTKLHGDGLDF